MGPRAHSGVELTVGEALVLQLLKAMADDRGVVDTKGERVLDNLLFLVAHGMFDDEGRIVGFRPFPRFDVDYRINSSGVYSRDAGRILERLTDRGLVRLASDGSIIVKEPPPSSVSAGTPLSRDLAEALEKATRFARLPPRDLEALVNNLLGIGTVEARVLVLDTRVTRLLSAREDARRLEAQGKLVDV